MATPTAAQNELIKLYLAAFLRAPEYTGYQYWSAQLDAGKTVAQIGWTIFSLDVVKAIYPTSLSNTQFVTAIYQNVFGKTPETSGLDYWRGRMDGGLTRGELVLEMINAGLNTADGTPGKAYIANRYNAAQYAVDQQISWQGELTPDYLRTQMDGVTATPTTLTTYANAVTQMAQTVGPRGITYSDPGFVESTVNDGSMAAALTLVIRGETFKGEIGATLGTVSKVPAGLTASLVKTSDLTATLTLNGKATAHSTLNSIANLTVTLTAADLTGGSLTGGSLTGISGVTRKDLTVSFYDVLLAESGGLLTGNGQISAALAIDLAADTATFGGLATALRSGSLANAEDIDCSGLAPAASTGSTSTTTSTTTVSVALRGDAAANTILASGYGGIIEGRAGNDTLTAASAIDRFVFSLDAATNGIDTISGFTVGTGGDILSFAAFLNKTGTANIATRTDIAPATALNNGDVLVYSGSVTSAAGVAALFNGNVFPAVTAAGKYVLITANITGDASIWYIANQTTPSSVDAAEITQVATLVGINNLELVPFVTANLA